MPRHGHRALVMPQPRVIPRRLGNDERVQALRSRDAGQTQHFLFRAEVAIQRREKQGQVELAESVQDGIRHGQHDVFGRIRDGHLLPFASDPDDALVRLHHEGLDAEGTREAEGTLDEPAGFLMFLPVQIAPVQMHRALSFPNSGNPSKFTCWGDARSSSSPSFDCSGPATVGPWLGGARMIVRYGALQTALCISLSDLLNLFDPFDP